MPTNRVSDILSPNMRENILAHDVSDFQALSAFHAQRLG